MKKTLCIALGFMFAVVSAVSAHPPKDILFTYDQSAKTLKINILHESKDLSKHFIDTLTLFINGKKKITQLASTQTNMNGQELIYNLPEAMPGDKIEATAECSLYGVLKKSFVIPALQKNDELKKAKK
jgi:hypothetical protein